jgi:hypothetical protein
MIRTASVVIATCILVSSASAQVLEYGTSTPPGNPATFGSGGQIPFAGNANFKLAISGHTNLYGGGMVLGFAPTSVPISASILLVDLTNAMIVPLGPYITEIPMAVPNIPAFIGYTGYAQAGVFDIALLGGFGLTNGIAVTILPDATPTRAYFPGQDFSSGANAPGQMSVLDLSLNPPSFRATGSVGFSGNIGSNYSLKIAVAEQAHVAYALGNGTGNQFVRAFDVISDPAGVVTHTLMGDIPTAGDVGGSVGQRDMEASPNGQYLFTVTGSSSAFLEVFDTSNISLSIPTAPVQTITFPGAAGGVTGLELSPDGNRLALLLSVDSNPALTLYNVVVGPNPLQQTATIPLPVFTGQYTPSDVHFTPDGRLLFVSGPNGFFSVIDTLPTPPQVLIAAGTWPSAGSGSLWFHGNAVATMNGSPVAVVAGDGTTGQFHLIDLNTTSVNFGAVIASFGPLVPSANGNISNHRMHARQNIVIATDGTGATNDCQWVDVIDLNQPIPPGFQSWRVKMPSFTTLTPGGLSSIPRDFDMF